MPHAGGTPAYKRLNMNRTLLRIGLPVLCPALFASGALAQTTPNVLVEQAVSVPDKVEQRYIGQVEAIDSVAIMPRVSGNLLTAHFREGDMVKAGQLLFELENTQYKARVQNAKALIDQIQSKIDYAEVTHDRYSKLVASKSVSQDNVDSARSTLDSLKAEKLAAEAELVIAEDNLNYTHITSPIAGRVGRVSYSVGNYITPQSGALLTVTGMEKVYVKFPISERDLLALFGNPAVLKQQAVVALTLADGKPYDRDGVVVISDSQVRSGTGTLNIWARFDNPDEKLIPGGIVTVRLSKKDTETVPSVPVSAVMHGDGKSSVYVLDADNKVSQREVALGTMIGNRQLIRSGVKEGETVIIDGMHKTAPGSVVTPIRVNR